MTVEILEMVPQRTATHHGAPATLAEIKRSMMATIQAAACNIDAGLGNRKPSAAWLSVRTDSKRHVLKFVVNGSPAHSTQAALLAVDVEREISERFNQVVPVNVVHGGSAHGGVSVYRNEPPAPASH